MNIILKFFFLYSTCIKENVFFHNTLVEEKVNSYRFKIAMS